MIDLATFLLGGWALIVFTSGLAVMTGKLRFKDFISAAVVSFILLLLALIKVGAVA